MVSYSAANTTVKLVSNSEIALVRYAYVTIGAIVFVAGVFYAVAYGWDYRTKHAQDQQMPSIQQTTQNANKEGDTGIGDQKPSERQRREK